MEKITANTAATITGYVVAAGSAAIPVLNAVQGSMHQQDWMGLVIAILSIFFGHKTTYNSVG